LDWRGSACRGSFIIAAGMAGRDLLIQFGSIEVAFVPL